MRKRKVERDRLKKLWDEDLSSLQLKKSRRRAVVLITVICFAFSVISFRLIDLMVLNHETLSKRASKQYLRTKTIKPQRGIIWDRRLREMAVNVEADSLYAVPSEIKDAKLLSSHLAPLIKTSASSLERRIIKKQKKDFLWLARKMDEKTSLKTNKLKDELGIKTIGFLTETKRYYPSGQTASHILGYTDIDNKGIEGIELRYNEYMTGEAKKVFLSRDARGNSLSGGVEEALPGNNIILTIDENIQHIAEREIAFAMEEWQASAAIAVMMDPETGEVLALANSPTYDPNFPVNIPWDKKRNRAVTDLFEPGSTIKSILASAAVEEGIVSLAEEFDVSKGYIVVGGKAIRDVHRNKILKFQDVIRKSSNVGAVQIGLKLGKDTYYKYLRKFGFGEKTGIDLPGEVRGILRRPDQWSGTSLGALSIGQEIGVTPLQVLRAYSAIANGGIMVKPYIISEIISPSGEVVQSFSRMDEGRVISVSTAETIKDILKTVVEEGGTARKAYISGNLVAGKTGTAQMTDPDTGRYSEEKFVSSFVGFVPADNPRLALIVVVYEPEGATYGGTVAAPVFKKIIEHTLTYLDIPMEKDDNHLRIVSR
jgi:cell division protein FtsI (penicillin-binding protein 3)